MDHIRKSCLGPDEIREQVAGNARAILDASDLPIPDIGTLNLRAYGCFGEESLQFIAAQWLREFCRLQRARETLTRAEKPTDLSVVIMHAEELGRLQERLYWRQGVDESTGKRREILALSGRRQVKNGQDGNSMRSDSSFSNMNGEQAQKYVNELNKRSPNLSWARMQEMAAKKFNVSSITIKRNLNNPKKVGSGRSE
jgi:hypothetical protein